MSHLVGIELSDRFAAIAPMIGGITSEMEKSFPPPNEVSVLIIQEPFWKSIAVLESIFVETFVYQLSGSHFSRSDFLR